MEPVYRIAVVYSCAAYFFISAFCFLLAGATVSRCERFCPFGQEFRRKEGSTIICQFKNGTITQYTNLRPRENNECYILTLLLPFIIFNLTLLAAIVGVSICYVILKYSGYDMTRLIHGRTEVVNLMSESTPIGNFR